MNVGVLFSGGKDSAYAAYLAKKEGYDVSCLISIVSDNKDSFMFHTPSISKVEYQAKAMDIPLITQATFGEKEKELEDLEKAISRAVEKYKIEGVVTGAVESVYQATRVQRICQKLGLECFNPLWQKDQIEILEDLVKFKFDVILIGVFAYPLTEKYLGREIDSYFIKEFKELQDKFEINPAGEGGEFETFVLDGPMFNEPLEVKSYVDSGEKHSWRREVKLE